MDINLQGVGFISDVFLSPSPGTKTVERSNTQIFEDFLNAAAGIYNDANTNLNASEAMQLRIATGESDDFIGLTLMQSKATASMQFITQLTTKAVEAYREIMRMQV